MSYRNICGCIVVAGALGACALEPSDDGDEIVGQTTAAVAANQEIRLRKLRSIDLNEGTDEIFLTAKAVGQSGENVIRPSPGTDHWIFATAPKAIYVDEHVGTAKADGTIVTVKLWEQDTPSAFDPHDLLCLFDVYQNGSGFIVFVNTTSATHLGVTAEGFHAVRCNHPATDGEYIVYLDV